MTKADRILNEIKHEIGIYPAAILASFIDQLPQRNYYMLWFIPLHDQLIKALGISSHQYYQCIKTLEQRRLIEKKFDFKIRKMLYTVNFKRLSLYDVDGFIDGEK